MLYIATNLSNASQTLCSGVYVELNVGLWTQIEDVHGSGGANVGLWTQTEDVHGLGGAPHQFNTLNECKEACFNNIECVAIDWEPSNVGRQCWTLSTSATSPTTAAGFITHYALNRDAVGETRFPLYTLRLQVVTKMNLDTVTRNGVGRGLKNKNLCGRDGRTMRPSARESTCVSL